MCRREEVAAPRHQRYALKRVVHDNGQRSSGGQGRARQHHSAERNGIDDDRAAFAIGAFAPFVKRQRDDARRAGLADPPNGAENEK